MRRVGVDVEDLHKDCNVSTTLTFAFYAMTISQSAFINTKQQCGQISYKLN